MTNKGKKNQGPKSVETLGRSLLQPHPDRIKLIRDWHADQAQERIEQTVACLNLKITFQGMIYTTGLAIAPSHALIMLSELDSVAKRLRAIATGERDAYEDKVLSVDPESNPSSGAKIIPFLRRHPTSPTY